MSDEKLELGKITAAVDMSQVSRSQALSLLSMGMDCRE